MPPIDSYFIEKDTYGYYDEKLLEYYPKPNEWQHRDEFPFDDFAQLSNPYSNYGWEDLPDTSVELSVGRTKAPSELLNEIEELKAKYKV